MTSDFGLCLFTTPKPFADPHIRRIQRNAIRSWRLLGPAVQVVLVGNEPGVPQVASELGVEHVRQVKCNPSGTPLVSDVFAQALAQSRQPVMGYVNADIILLPDTLAALELVARCCDRFMAVGRRWDLDVRHELKFGSGWVEELERLRAKAGRLHPAGGSDYFFFRRATLLEIPDFAVGRAGWDNWMIYAARRAGWATIDVSGAVTAIHQHHDYSHLTGSQPHYRLPESAENVRLAGGRRRLFTLADVDHTLANGSVRPAPLTLASAVRRLEVAPLLKTRSGLLAELFFTLAHPLRAAGEWAGRVRYALRSRRSGSHSGGLAGE